MKVFKFGGASVKDAQSVKNVGKVLRHEGFHNTVVVISAMGKMTNAFESIVNAYYHKNASLQADIQEVKEFHFKIAQELFEAQDHPLFGEIEGLFEGLDKFMTSNTSRDYNYIYDQMVGYGELLSTKIVSTYLGTIGIENTLKDVRECVKTNSDYRDAIIDWEATQKAVSSEIHGTDLTITQGFLGADFNGNTTTLGREGSDFSAAIFAYCLNAESVTIWKDVDGVLNADPRFFSKTELLEQISYSEAIEMAFYGASVIHPKTLKPLENKLIPLYVRSFEKLKNKGTSVSKGAKLIPFTPCYVLKRNQILVSVSTLDFSFIVEHNVSDIFKLLHDYHLKVDLIQNSAISFSVCIDDSFNNFPEFLKVIKSKYRVKYNENVSLYTVRHFNEEAIAKIEAEGTILLEQISRETVQIVLK